MSLFESSTTSYCKQIRDSNVDRQKFIDESLVKIRQDVFSSNSHKISNAILKLFQISLYGYDICFATVPMITLAAQTKIQYKMLGYLGVSHTITFNREFKSLLFNTINKDLVSNEVHIKSAAMDCLSYVIDENLAPQIAPTIITFVKSPNLNIRKRIVVLLSQCIIKYPELKSQYFPYLIDFLNDSEPIIQGICATIIAQFSTSKTPEIFELSDRLVKLFINSSNNRLLNKILKILLSIELNKSQMKALETRIFVIFQGSSAYSLLFECIRFTFLKLSKSQKILDSAMSKLKHFLHHQDLNLQYMSLCILKDLVNINREIVISMKNDIAKLLMSNDWSVRFEAIELMSALVNRGNLKSLVKVLIDLIKQIQNQKLIYEGFIEIIISKIIQICSHNDYSLVNNFDWYVEVLTKLIVLSIDCPAKKSCDLISRELIQISLRIEEIRPFLLGQLAKIICKIHESNFIISENFSTLFETMIWITSEYIENLESADILTSILQKNWISSLNSDTQLSIIHSILKSQSYIFLTTKNKEKVKFLVDFFHNYSTNEIQIQERINSYKYILNYFLEKDSNDDLEILRALFLPELTHVSKDAQNKVQVAITFDIDAWYSTELEIIANPPPIVTPVKEPNQKSPQKKKSRRKKKQEYLTEDSESYPEQTYKIKSIDNAEEINITEGYIKTDNQVQPVNVSDQKKKKTNRTVKSSKFSKTRSDTVLNITIDTFMSNPLNRLFESSVHESRLVKGVLIADVIEKIKDNYPIKVMDQNESTVLINVSSSNVIFVLIKIENSCLHIIAKSHSPSIPEGFIDSLKTLLFDD